MTRFLPSSLENKLVQESGQSAIYIIAGGAKFHIPTSDEIVAMGRSLGEVVQVPAGSLADVSLIPAQNTMVRDRDRDEVYAICSGLAVHIPTPDALVLLGLAWANVRVLPAGGTNQLNRHEIPSQVATPPSMVFGPVQDAVPPGSATGARYPRLEVPGVTLPNTDRVVEIRGWLRSVDSHGNKDPDWGYQLEPDVEWLEEIGVDLATFVKVGDLLYQGLDHNIVPGGEPDYQHSLSTPGLHVELNGWSTNVQIGRTKPGDWTTPAGPGDVLPVVWPFPPLNPAQAAGFSLDQHIGAYVRMSGSLVTDQPHLDSPDHGWNAAGSAWQGSSAKLDEGNPARWTEMHPFDLLEVLPAKTRKVTMRGVALYATPGLLPQEASITAELNAPSAQPPNTFLSVEEHVGPETRFSSIVEGNAQKNGAQITVGNQSATVHVKVRSDAIGGANGKFKALYTVRWKAIHPD